MRHKQPDIHQTDTNGHDSFDQLCALASSGALTASEWSRLADHLKVCSQCREELAKYQEIGTFGLSLIAPTDPSLDVESEWSPESAVAKLMRTLQEQEESDARPATRPVLATMGNSRRWLSTMSLSHLNTALTYAAVVVLFAVISTSLYFSGIRIGERRANAHSQSSIQPIASVEALSRERTELEHELQSRSAKMEFLSRELQDANAVVGTLASRKKAMDETINRLERTSRDHEVENNLLRFQYRTAEQERLAVNETLKASEANLLTLQRKFDLLRDQHAADLEHIASLESKIGSISHQPQQVDYVEARQLPSNEPELADLMGARDLFIADVYDIDKTGLPQKPFGRVFYTKGKSLLFYAFDLDRQPGVKTASTFQVWGRRGYGDTHPLNMGMMYLDNETSKRWMLKFNDAKALSQVDAVFVTIEPHGGSNAPKGRQLLYASLRTPPNHP
jgi:hypothetical protein